MDILTQPQSVWGTFALIACRVGTIMMIVPIFGGRSVPAPLKIGLSLLLSLILLPLSAARGAALPDEMPAFLTLVARELLLGALIGFAVLLVFTALQAAGYIVGLQMGFSLANVVNPLTADHASLVDQFYALLAALVFFSMNGHHALIGAIQQSFDLAPVGRADLGLPPAAVLLGWGRDLFAIAARISLPVIAALLLTDVAMAVIARSVPQLNVFVVGMPAKVAVAFIMLIVTVPITALIMARAFANLGQATQALLRFG
ncbi:MAG TPA: flagellar biosynthetic protein FliR [Chloroflexota bacterium]|nr:flagellar biosynthetic protein FliR [Chloroflexota bacterium]